MSRYAPSALSALALVLSTSATTNAAPSGHPSHPAPGRSTRAVSRTEDCTSERRVSPRLGAPLPTLAAVVPGALLHGSGHYTLGHTDTALTLLALEGVGAGALLVSGTTLVLTGASRYFVAPAALLAVGGAGLFTMTLLADIYGTVAPPCGFGGPPRFVPIIEADVGYRHVYDPQFDYRHFGVAGLSARYGALRVSPSAWWALDDDNRLLRLEVGVSPVGARPRTLQKRADRFEVETALTHRDFGSEGFSIDTVEISAGGRLDLETIAVTLDGSFAEASGGGAVATTSYGDGIPPDTDLVLLARFGFGVYLGQGRGEASVYYDHRHDGYAAGTIVPGIGSGILGYFGLASHYYVTERWGIGAEAMLGSAYVGGLSARFRQR